MERMPTKEELAVTLGMDVYIEVDVMEPINKITEEELAVALGMDREYVVDMPDDESWPHSFTSKDVMKLCKNLRIPRKVRVLAPQSKYYNQELPVIADDYWGNWYQVKLCTVTYGSSTRDRKYTFGNSKITISEETLAAFRLACQTREKPKDYIGREFNAKDIIFCREFFRVKKVFGGFMLIQAINCTHDYLYRTVTNNDAKAYLLIDDPIVHLHI